MEDCRFKVGDIVQHFKRENVNPETAEYLYRILAFAQHTENGEKLVIYQALYPPYKTCARPFDLFSTRDAFGVQRGGSGEISGGKAEV